MHEFALAEEMLHSVLSALSQPDQILQGDAAQQMRVAEIHVRVGSLTGVVQDSMRFAFDRLSAGTAAEGARLIFDEDRAMATCRVCGDTNPAELPLLPVCSRCGGPLAVSGGTSLLLERILLVEMIPDAETRPDPIQESRPWP